MTGRRWPAIAMAGVAALFVSFTVVAARSIPPQPFCLDPVLPCPSPSPSASPSPTPAGRDLIAYRGLGTWVDAYDFSREFRGRIAPGAVDDMASQGVRTLYIQAAKQGQRSPNPLLSPDLLGQFLERAHQKGMRVVAWYLPTFTDPDADWRHLDAILRFTSRGHRFDSIGVDIESRDVKDAKTRGDRLVALSRRLRKATDLPVSAIVVPPVILDEINPNYWPNFPWKAIAPSYDVWVPMAYYTFRKPESGYRDAYRYVTENIRLLRRDVGKPNAAVHVIGGIGDRSTGTDYDGLVRGARDGRALGASSYDYATTARSAWATLRRAPR